MTGNRRTGLGEIDMKRDQQVPIIDFLADDQIPDNEKEANKVRRAASRYWLSEDRKLYRRSFGGPYMSCLHPEKVGQLLAELYEGVCAAM